MTAERFADLIAAYGADPARWPPAERTAAQAFAATPDGRAALAEAAALDALLAAAPHQNPSAALHARVLSALPGARAPLWRDLFELAWPGALWRPAAALALSAAIGVAAGLWGSQAVGIEDGLTLAFDAGDEAADDGWEL